MIHFEDAAQPAPRGFSLMLKPAGALCNLGCTYCYYLDKGPQTAAGGGARMSLSALEHIIRSYCEACEGPELQFIWHGGEPLLMGPDFFRAAIELERRYALGRPVFNSIQTNGLLLSPEWAELFRQANFLVGISIDGPQEVHGRYRMDRGGAPVFERVVAAVELLRDAGVQFNTLTAVSRASEGRGAEVYRFLKSLGSRHMQFLPVVEYVRFRGKKARPLIVEPKPEAGGAPAPWSVSGPDFGQFMADIFDEWIRSDIGTVYVQLFDAALAAWCGLPPGVCTLSRRCEGTAVVEQNGDLYPCDHFVYPAYRIGNLFETPLRELMERPEWERFAARKLSTLPGRCQRCPWLPACNGECPQHRDPGSGVSALCEGYRLFFSHAAPQLDRLRAELFGPPKTPVPE